MVRSPQRREGARAEPTSRCDPRRRGLDRSQAERYLRLLGVEFGSPDLRGLTELTRAHAARVPFENVSKLYRFRREGRTGIPDVEEYLDGMERFHFGGTCYANNHHLGALLEALGFDVRRCGADMREPDAHLALIVRVQGRDHLVDAGYAAPFLGPLPLDLDDEQEIVNGGDRYAVRPRDAAGRTRLELHRGGALAHGYLLKPDPRRIEEFDGVVARSFLPGATFMNTVMLARHAPGLSMAIHGLSLLRVEGGRVEARTLRDRDEVIEEVERCFGIPAPITAEAMAGITSVRDPWA